LGEISCQGVGWCEERACVVGFAGGVAGGEPDLAGVPPLPPLWMTGGAHWSAQDPPPLFGCWAVTGRFRLGWGPVLAFRFILFQQSAILCWFL
jgi:hypothetical protein